jgi:hypothetical protein
VVDLNQVQKAIEDGGKLGELHGKSITSFAARLLVEQMVRERGMPLDFSEEFNRRLAELTKLGEHPPEKRSFLHRFAAQTLIRFVMLTAKR